MYEYAFIYSQKNDENAYPDIENYISNFTISPKTIQHLITYARNQGEKIDTIGLNHYQKQLELQLKARIAKQWYGALGLHKVLHTDDKAITEAIEQLSGKKSSQKVSAH